MFTILPIRVQGAIYWFAALVLLGYFLPRLVGASLFDPHLMLSYSFLSIPFLSPIACAAVRDRRAPLLKIAAAAALFGWISSLLLIALRIFGANREVQAPRFILPDTPVLLSLSIIALSASIFGASLSALVTLSTSTTDNAMRIMRSGFLLALLAVVFTARNGSDSFRDFIAGQLTYSAMPRFALIVSLVLLAHAALFFVLAIRNPRYSKPFTSE
jgi:hypothetical protein